MGFKIIFGILSVLNVLHSFTTPVYCQIVDTKSPIIIHDGNTNENSLFGYSLAFIKGRFGGISFEHEGSSQVYGTLFIGAPKESHEVRGSAWNSGVVRGCQFSQNAQVECTKISGILGKKPMPDPTCRRQKVFQYPENETEQWIGASLAATSEHLYACAPRWKLNGYYSRGGCSGETAMLGACYKATSATGESSVLGPYNLVNDYDAYLYSEYGFSSHTTPTGSLLVGAPYGGRWSDDNPGMYVEHIQTSNSRSRERVLIHHSGAGGGSHSLLGYSITSGTTGNSREYVAVGVPRSNNLFGSVLINYLGLHNPALRIIGEGFGSYFGYAITTANVDGDDKGKDELLVGAPYFTSDFNSNSNMDSGCVFIYSIDADSPSYQQVAKLCLGSEAGGARFGSAIANLGDINNDRKDDFAVGAPYHDDRVGTIFIYFGGVPLSTKPAQVITGKSFNIPNLHGFGTFLLGGKVDVDGNKTPDLAISSFESNHVVVLRTRPVATASQRVTYHSADSSGSLGKIYKFLPTPSQDYVRVHICVEFKFSVHPVQENELECRLNFDMDKGTEFYDHLPAGAELRHNFSSTKKTCLDRHLRIKPEIVGESGESSIRFRSGLSYSATEPLASQPVQHALLNLTQDRRSNSQFQRTFASFNPFLPSPIPPTFSEWERLEIAEDNCDSDGKKGCDPNLKLATVYFGEENGKNKSQQLIMVGQTDALVFYIKLGNKGETAYRPTVRVSLKFSVEFEVPKLDWRWTLQQSTGQAQRILPVSLTSSEDNLISTQTSRQSRPLQKDSESVFELRLANLNQIKVKEGLKGKLEVKVEAFPEGQEEKEKVETKLLILLEAGVNVEVKAAERTTGQTEIDPRISRVDLAQIFIIKNTGISYTALEKVKVDILVPTQLTFNNALMPIIGISNPSQYSSRMRCEADGFSFYYAAAELARNNTLTPLQLNKADSDKTPVFSSGDTVIKLSGCQAAKRPPSCSKITCVTDLASMETRAIRLQMYLIPNAAKNLISDDTAGISIESQISVSFLNTVTKGSGEATRNFLMTKQIASWILILAAIGGSLLLLLVMFGLFKCGFFRRKTKEQLQQAKRQTQLLLADDEGEDSKL